jgi:hypothetical protein
MTTQPEYLIGLMTALAVVACSDDPTEPTVEECTPETTSVTVTVTTGQSTVFNWEPACPVALLLVEDEAEDMWGLTTDEATWDNLEVANLIAPPLTYGVVPAGIPEIQEPLGLEEKVTYELILWRILPAGSTATCEDRFVDACLLTVHPFTR